MPAFELVAVLATDLSGPDGKYRFRQPFPTIQGYLDAVRKKQGLMLLDIQPGRSDFATEIAYYHQFLKEPDVGLSIEPAWQTQPHPRGPASINATELNAIQAQVSETVTRFNLPDKLLVVHEATPQTVTDPVTLQHYPGVALVLSDDVSNGSQAKHAGYTAVSSNRPFTGVMLTSPHDRPLMSPAQIAALTPSPDFVDYK
jgi:hypothetical protein